MQSPPWSRIRRYEDNYESCRHTRQSGPSVSNSCLCQVCSVITTDISSMSCFSLSCVHNMKCAQNQVYLLASSSLCFCYHLVGMPNPLSGLLFIPQASSFSITHHVGKQNSINPTSPKKTPIITNLISVFFLYLI